MSWLLSAGLLLALAPHVAGSKQPRQLMTEVDGAYKGGLATQSSEDEKGAPRYLPCERASRLARRPGAMAMALCLTPPCRMARR